MNATERIKEFIAYKGLNYNAFEAKCGLSKRYVGNLGKSMQSDAIEKIILSFPELNADWLITGRGEMLYNNSSSSNSEESENNKYLREYIELLKSQIEDLKKASARTAAGA